jgi:hypothetical protein
MGIGRGLSLEGYVPKPEVAGTQTGDDERFSAKFDFCTEATSSSDVVESMPRQA